MASETPFSKIDAPTTVTAALQGYTLAFLGEGISIDKDIEVYIEQAATILSKTTRLAAQLRGGSPEYVVELYAAKVLDRAKEMLRA